MLLTLSDSGYSQSMKNNLTPVTITDKNGRVTTVHRKDGTAKSAMTQLPLLTIPQPQEKLAKDRLLEAKEERRKAKEKLAAGKLEKETIKTRLEGTYRALSQGTFLIHSLDNHYLESFQIMDRLVNREPIHANLSKETYKRYVTMTGDTFLNWARLAERHYDALTDNPLVADTALLPGLFSAGIYFNARRMKEHGEPQPNEQQERNYLLLNFAARGSSLEGRRINEGSGWGVIQCLDNEDLEAFSLTCTDPDQLQRVCTVIKAQPVTRFQEAVAIADGDTINTLASGAL